jgi:TolA-binding protein
MFAWSTFLDRARTALARGDVRQALSRAESLLSVDAPELVRAGALLVAADAAYAMGAYARAGARYGEFLSRHGTGPAAPRAAMALGWAELRGGHRENARRWWTAIADRFPADPRAPLALVLAAEVARQAGDTAGARALLDRVIARYPSTPRAGTARLARFIVAMREHREDEAVRDLDEVILAHGTAVIDDRQRVIEALAVPGAEAQLEARADEPSRADAGAGAVEIHRGERLEQFAVRFVEAGERDSAPSVLHGLVLLGVADNGWADVVVAAVVHRLADAFPSYPAAPALLARVATSAAAAGQLPIARRAYEELLARYPGREISATAGVELAGILVRVGAIAEARVHLDRAVAAGGKATPRALLLLAELELARGDLRRALAAYDRLLQDHPGVDRSAESLLSHARLLDDFGQAERARPLLHLVVERSDAEVAAEAAYRLARILGAEGQHADAIEWYMTAAYVAEGSSWSRHALLSAGNSLTLLDRNDEALIAYRKLMRLAEPRAPHTTREAAYRIAQILRGAGRYEEALDMYLTAAGGGTGSSTEARALVGAVACLVAMGDRASAEATYHRLVRWSATEPELLAQARTALSGNGRAAQDGGSALPGNVRQWRPAIPSNPALRATEKR